MSQAQLTFPPPRRATETARETTQISKDYYAKALSYAAQGKQVAWCMATVPTEFLEAFDVAGVWPENFSTVCAARGVAVHFIEQAESLGYASEICSYMRVDIGYLKQLSETGRIPAESPRGGLARPTMLLTASQLCDPRTKAFQAMNEAFLKVPIHVLDIPGLPYGTDVNDPRVKAYHVKHYYNELVGLKDFMEKVTGRKYDPDGMCQVLSLAQESARYWYQTLELRKRIPCPFPSQDYFACILPQLFMLGDPIILSFYRRLYEEVKCRAENKIGVVTEEKYRICTVGIPPWYNMAIFNYMEELGMIGVMDLQYYVGRPIEADASDPLMAMAERAWLKNAADYHLGAEYSPESWNTSLSPGTIPPNLLLKWVEEYCLDGVIMFLTRSCRATAFGQTHLANLLRANGVPVLMLEIDMADPRNWSDSLVKGQMNGFVDILKGRKASQR